MGKSHGCDSPTEEIALFRPSDLERTTGFEPATLLAKKKVMILDRRVGSPPSSRRLSPGSSAQSVESAPLQRSTFNASNLCELITALDSEVEGRACAPDQYWRGPERSSLLAIASTRALAYAS